jgi:hypothetical protein
MSDVREEAIASSAQSVGGQGAALTRTSFRSPRPRPYSAYPRTSPMTLLAEESYPALSSSVGVGASA